MIHTLARSLRQHKKGSIITMLLSILEVVFEILIPLCMANLIDYGIEQGDMAQLISSVFTIVAVFVCMLYLSIPLTAVAVVVVALSLKLAGGAMKRIGGFFMR